MCYTDVRANYTFKEERIQSKARLNHLGFGEVKAESTGFEPVRALLLKGLAIPRIGPLCQLSKISYLII